MALDDILNQIDQLAELAEQERNATQPGAGDMVTFMTDEGEMTGQIESVDEQMANVRIMALAGDNMEPTDDVVTLPLDQLSLINAPAAEDDPEPAQDDEQEMEKGAFVMWNTPLGKAIGKVIGIGDTLIVPETGQEHKGPALALVEVYDGEVEYEGTGVHVVHPCKNLTPCDPPAIKMGRLMVKMKNYEAESTSESGWFEGLASAYGEVDLGGDTVSKGAYNQTLKHNDGKFMLMFDHGWGVKDVAGVAYATDTTEGLQMKGEMPIHIASVADIYEKIKFMGDRGRPLGLSIGYTPVKTEPGKGGTRILKEIALHEITITPYPMDTFARIRDAKSRKISYHLKRAKWQSITPDAPDGNRDQEVDWESLCDQLTEIRTLIRK